MVVHYVTRSLIVASVAAYLGLATVGHALHDVTCDHDYISCGVDACRADGGVETHEHHSHQHHDHDHQHGDRHHNSGPVKNSPSPSGSQRSGHPPQHDHDCQICHFAAATVAVVVADVSLPESAERSDDVVAVTATADIFRPASGHPRAPPA